MDGSAPLKGLQMLSLSQVSAIREFGKAYGVDYADGPMAGLYARAIVVIDETGKVIYTQLVPEHIQEPDYEAALKAVQ